MAVPKTLQREIVVIIFAEIQCLGFAGNSLAGVVAEFSAFFFFCHNAPFHAQEKIVVNPGSISAI